MAITSVSWNHDDLFELPADLHDRWVLTRTNLDNEPDCHLTLTYVDDAHARTPRPIGFHASVVEPTCAEAQQAVIEKARALLVKLGISPVGVLR